MYTQFFGFTEKPFNVTPDPRFLYLSPGHQEALASMIYGINERRGFISVVGEIGTGKTTLIQTLFTELGKDVKTVFIFNTNITFIQLLQNMLLELELSPEGNDKTVLINQLNLFLIQKLSLGENVALIIDEAQNISPNVLEELRMLSNLETTKEKLIQIVLVGQPELDNKLKSPSLRQLKQRIAINCYLPPLNKEEQMQYIAHRLFVAGSENNHIFSKKALDCICSHANGIPRVINILCDNALLTAYGKQRTSVDTDIVKSVISDYDRSISPIIETRSLPSAPTTEKHKIFSRKLLVTIPLALLILISLIFGLIVFNKRFNLLDRFIIPKDIESSFISKKNFPLSDDTKNTVQPQIYSESSSNDINSQGIITGNYDSQNELIATNYMTIDEQLPSEQVLPIEQSMIVPNKVESAENNSKVVFAREGDMISALILREYGILNDSICDLVKRGNPTITDLDRIEIGQKIIFPALEPDNFIIELNNDIFTIHVSTFSSYESALELHQKLEDKGYAPVISLVKIAGDNSWFRVTTGDFLSRSQAIQFAKISKLFDQSYAF